MFLVRKINFSVLSSGAFLELNRLEEDGVVGLDEVAPNFAKEAGVEVLDADDPVSAEVAGVDGVETFGVDEAVEADFGEALPVLGGGGFGGGFTLALVSFDTVFFGAGMTVSAC